MRALISWSKELEMVFTQAHNTPDTFSQAFGGKDDEAKALKTLSKPL